MKLLALLIAFAFVCGIIAVMLSDSSPEPTPAVSTAAQIASRTPSEDEAAKLIGLCGKPTQDFTRTEGGQPIRHVIYKKQNVELMYSRQGIPFWALVGIFPVNGDDEIGYQEANSRLQCAAGSIRTVLDTP